MYLRQQTLLPDIIIILNGFSTNAENVGHVLFSSEFRARQISRVYIMPPNIIDLKWQTLCLSRVKNRTVESSSRRIWSSATIVSSNTTRLRHRTSTSTRLSCRRRSGLSGYSRCTTSHFCTSLHMNLTTTRRCPGLVCWISVRDDTIVSYLMHTWID